MGDKIKSDSVLLKSIDDIKEIIESDITRLRTIVDAINTGDMHIDINDRLISNLNNIDFQDRDVEIAIEYLTLILSNFESQKINYNKQVSEELIGVLRHTLSAVRNLENCAVDMIHHLSTEAPCEVQLANENKTTTVTTGSGFKEVLVSLLPNNKVSNSIFWIVVFFGLFGLTYTYSPSLISAFNSTAYESAKTIKKIKETK